jgi:two-component system chemotaxis response regulator CheY
MANILIVDDSFLMRRKLNHMLTHEGHVIVGEASSGEEGFRKYQELNPDLVTMDINMPNISGIEAIEKIMKAFPDAKIIVISIIDDKSMVFKALEKGAKHYVFKPISIDKLSSVINQVLNIFD